MKSQAIDITVLHNPDVQRYEAEVDGLVSVLDYEIDDGRMIFTHTYVPPALRGRGIAEKLVRTGLDGAREKNLKVVPQCSYVAVFLQRHREYAPLVK